MVSDASRRPVRVLHVVWRLSTTGGIQRVVRAIADGVDLSSVETWIATVRPILAEDELDRVPAGIEAAGLTGRVGPFGRALAVLRFARIARRVRPDVIHLHSGTAYLGVLAATVSRPRLRLLDVHDAPGNGRHGRVVEWFEGWLVRRGGFIAVAHSQAVANEAARRWHVAHEGLAVVPLGIEVSAFHATAEARASWRATHSIGAEDAVVIYVARPVPSKNVSLFAAVAASITRDRPGVRFVLVSNAPATTSADDTFVEAARTGVITVVGAPDDDALLEALSGADAYCSTSDYEGFGLSVAEAMAAGLPVVATAVGGVVEVVADGETGALVPPGDVDELRKRIVELLDDPELRSRQGVAGRHRVRTRFDVQQMVAAYASLYSSVAPLRLCILKTPDFGQWAHDHRDGSLPYRVDVLRERGLDLEWTDRHLHGVFALPAMRSLVATTERAGAPWLQTVLLAPRITRSDATLAFFESEGHFLAALRSLPGPHRRGALVILSCWLADLLEREPPGSRRERQYRMAYRHVDRVVCLSANQVPIIENRLGLRPGQVHFVPFGIDLDEFTPSDTAGDYVVAVGRDRGRDWKTFLAAAARTDLPTRVACRRSDIGGLSVPDNVEVLGYLDRDRYRELLSSARVSVVPTLERAYPTGQTVLLESFALRRATVVTDTPAMRSYVDPGTTAVVTPVGAVDALADAISSTWDDVALRHELGQAGREAVERTFNARRMWREIGEIVEGARR